MARPKTSTFDKAKTVAENRRARFEYFIEEVFEAGIALQGTEVKSLRGGRANLQEAYVRVQDGQAWLVGCHISPYEFARNQDLDPVRPRQPLSHRGAPRGRA